MSEISQALLEILVCPRCKTKVKENGSELVCCSTACGLAYPVENGIPVMLIDRARSTSRPEQDNDSKSK